jgi:hypothetical protein
MSTILKEVYDAFLAAGVSEEQASKAAEAIATHEERFAKLETDLTLVKWVTGLCLALIVGNFAVTIAIALQLVGSR